MKQQFLKRMMAVLGVTLMAVTTVGCGSNSSGDVQNDGNAGNKEVKVSALIAQSQKFPGLQEMIDKLKEEENITVDLQVVPDEEINNLMMMKLSSGSDDCPDMFGYNFPHIFGMVDEEAYLADLSDAKWVDELISPSNVTSPEDGKVYGFPFTSSNGIVGMIYNKDVFEKNGWKIPNNQKEFEALCDQMKAAGMSPILIPRDNYVGQNWMSSGTACALGSAEAVQEYANSILTHEKDFTDYKEAEEALDTYLSMFKKGYVNDDYLTASQDDNKKKLVDGEGGMIYGGAFMASGIVNAFPDANLGMFAPIFDYNKNEVVSSAAMSMGFAAYKNSKNLDTVKEIFDLWSTPEYLELYFEGRPGFPSINGVDNGGMNKDITDLYNKKQSENKVVPETNVYLTEIEPLNKTTLWVYYLDAPNKDESAKDVLEKFQNDVNGYMKDKGVEGF